MRLFTYVQPGLSDIDYPLPATVVMTDDDVMEEYWDYWYERMVAKYGEGHELITRDNCIDDWCVVHWATEIPDV